MLRTTALQSQSAHGYLNLPILNITQLNSTSFCRNLSSVSRADVSQNGKLKTINAVGATWHHLGRPFRQTSQISRKSSFVSLLVRSLNLRFHSWASSTEPIFIWGLPIYLLSYHQRPPFQNKPTQQYQFRLNLCSFTEAYLHKTISILNDILWKRSQPAQRCQFFPLPGTQA